MPFLTFSEYVCLRERLLAPDRARVAGQTRLNSSPLTNDQRRKLKVNPTRPPNPVRPVARVDPQDMIGKVTSPVRGGRPAGSPGFAGPCYFVDEQDSIFVLFIGEVQKAP